MRRSRLENRPDRRPNRSHPHGARARRARDGDHPLTGPSVHDPGASPCCEGPGKDQPESDGRSCGCLQRPDHRTGLSPRAWPTSRRNSRAQRRRSSRQWRDTLCYARTLQPSEQTYTTLCAGGAPIRSSSCGRGHGGSQPIGKRKRNRPASSSWIERDGWSRTRRPYVTLKAGMTLDGKIATATGESQWITGPAARKDVHRLRAQVNAVLTGVGTVRADNPSLTARTGARLKTLASRQPLRIVVDSKLRIPSNAQVLSRQQEARTIVATTGSAPAA